MPQMQSQVKVVIQTQRRIDVRTLRGAGLGRREAWKKSCYPEGEQGEGELAHF